MLAGINGEVVALSPDEKEAFMREWFENFVPPDKRPKAIACHCFSDGEVNGYLWHVFSFGILDALEGDEARAAFDCAEKREAVLLENWDDIAVKISDISGISAGDLDPLADVIVTAEDYSWTYVKTHEQACGPYFFVR